MNRKLPPTTALRERLQREILVLPGAFNAITAKLVEAAGFEGVYISGAGVTNSVTGMPDAALLTLTEMAAQARYICNAVDLPCISDADTGYGEALNVARTVGEFEAAGLAGIHIEDQMAPKRCGHLDGKQLVAPIDMARKIQAAVRSRRDPDFLIIARTDARGVTSFDDAVERAQLYLDAGADAIFPEALQTPAEFKDFSRIVNAPLLANMTEFGKSPLMSVSTLGEMGYKMVIYPMTQFRIMMRAASMALQEIKATGTQAGLLGTMQTRAELYELIDYRGYQEFDASVNEWSPKSDAG